MNDEAEQILAQIKPCGASRELRPRILNAVDAKLRASRSWRMQKRVGLITAAMVIFGVGLNVWVDRSVSRRIAAIFPPPAPLRGAVEIAVFVSKYADPEAGQLIYQQLVGNQSTACSSEKYFAYIRKLTVEAGSIYKDKFYEKSEKNPSLDRHKPGSDNRDPADMRGMLQLDSRLTA
jgi:hypothetical protein